MNLEGYEIEATIARSPRTLVRRGRRARDRAPVVIKSLARDYPSAHEIAQLELEYRTLRKLDTPGVPRPLDLVREGNELAMIVADFGGESLPSCAGAGDTLDVFFTIAAAVTRTLGAIHGQGVIHKDVKPRNILMNQATREVKLIDFNSATELSLEHQNVNLWSRLEGSLPYMSPEQTGRMNRDLDYRSDYYSLGVTFFELLTGALPFSASDMMGWVHCHISKPAPDPRSVNPAIPEPLAQIVGKLMAKNPEDRYQSARGLLKDLERCQRESTDRGAIAPFALGAHDVPERFQVSQKLFAREREVAALLEAFEAASQGPAKLLLVGGYSGVGKSTLIHEIHTAIVRRRGHFIVGKFDQLERNVPYGALLQALRGLMRHLLAEPEDRLQAWRQRLSSALGQHGKVLVDLIPELEQIVGAQPPVPELSPHEARARLQRLFRELIKALAQPEHPLVVFVDDLQWMDASTPELLVNLLGDEGLCHVLVIGAYRDNEVKEGHILELALKELAAKRPDAIAHILLEPLSEESVGHLVADTLRCDRTRSAPLAGLLFQKTAGNPFFLNELLRVLHRDGAFRFDVNEGRWDWNDQKIEEASASDNVVDLMVTRLRRLPAETLHHVCLAACLGNRFELATLSRVAEQPAGPIAAALWEAITQDVLLPLGSAYRLVRAGGTYDEAGLDTLGVAYQFKHDRVQQAAYQLLDAQERAQVHLRVGRLMLASATDPEREEKVFDLVNHLNLGRVLITGHDERARLARLNSVAARRAKRSAAYAVALSYLEASLGLLSKEEWSAAPELHFECCRMRVECIFLTGAIERAAALADELLDLAPSKVARGSAVELKVAILEHQGRMLEAVDTIRRSLTAFGIELPADHAEIDRRIGEGIGKMQAHLARVRVEDLVHLRELEDPELCTAMNLLYQIIPSAIQTYPPLFILAELVMFDLALVHGVSAVSCKNFVDCGIIQGGILGDYQTAYRLGQVAFALLDRYAPTHLESAITFVFATFVSHWRAPAREGFDALARAVLTGLDLGDLRHPAYARVHIVQRMLLVGRALDECHAEGESAIAYLEGLQAKNNVAGARAVQRVVARLRGSGEHADPSDAFTAALVAFGNAQWCYSYGQAETMASFVLGDLEGAEAWQAFTAPFLPAGTALFSIPDYHLVQSLILTRKWAGASAADREAMLVTLLANQEKLRIWAENCPANYLHKHKLCAAEIARVRGAPSDEIIALYDEAIASASDGFVHIRALANELLAAYWGERRQRKIAKTFLEEAHYLYQRWGARAKLDQLERRYPDWLGQAPSQGLSVRTTTATQTATVEAGHAGSLDLASITKATQAISSEVKAERLFARLMATIIENAGAQRGCLILKAEGGGALTVEARAHVQGEPADAGRSIPIERCEELCPDIVRYVARTGHSVVVDDAARDPAYRDDAYIQQNGVKSLLCVPVLNQGKLVAILYAENNAATRAFTAQRLSLLQVIASQAAISITNARLYDSLEEKVAERTRELAEKNREVAAMLNSMQQGIFTVGPDLLIRPQYSAHLEELLGTAAIAGRDCLTMLFDGSSVGRDALGAMRSALQFSFGVPGFIAKANESHLAQEFHRTNAEGQIRHFEVDWNLIVDESDEVYKILVALREVTLLQQLKETAAANARELEIVGQILDGGFEAFQQFCASTRGLLREVAAVVAGDAPLTREALERMFRNMHTIKGHARTLGLSHLVDTVHLAEEPYAELRSERAPVPERSRPAVGARLAAGVDAVLRAIESYEDVCRRKLGEVGHGSRARFEQATREIRALVEDAAGGRIAPPQALQSVQRALDCAEAVALTELVKDSARMLPSLARQLGKAEPIVACDDGGARLAPAWAQVMRDVLVHAFRNSLDHGFEPPDQRQAHGKPAQGRISVHLDATDGGAVIRVADDGRGLPLGALRQRAQASDEVTGAASDEEVASTIFISGVSTATRVSATSGRGVGMDAIRSFVQRAGGEVRVAFTAGGRDGYRPFELVFEVPDSAVVADGREPTGHPRDPLARAARL